MSSSSGCTTGSSHTSSSSSHSAAGVLLHSSSGVVGKLNWGSGSVQKRQKFNFLFTNTFSLLRTLEKLKCILVIRTVSLPECSDDSVVVSLLEFRKSSKASWSDRSATVIWSRTFTSSSVGSAFKAQRSWLLKDVLTVV